ncbi:MAG: TonB-dependent receptor [Sphingopyxis terrae]|nr:TonB-dependent receptor [Sphingopyxis terrae]
MTVKLFLTCSALALFPTAAFAQQASADEAATEAGPAEAAPGNGDIIVTGSRIARSGTFTAVTPVTSLSGESLEASQPASIAAAVNNIPSLAPTIGQNNGAGTTQGSQNFLNLRGLGMTRTLTLLDGRRFTSSTADSRVDVNILPSGLVSRVDVVTGGASAAYGSDAVAGVVNFILDKEFTGLKGHASYGMSGHGDNEDFRAVLNWGGDITDRLHMIASIEYSNNLGVAGDARDFRRNAGNFITNPAGGTPQRLRADRVLATATTGGLIVTGAGGTTAANASFQGIQFGPGGTLLPYDYGTITVGRGTASGQQAGGDGYNTFSDQEITRPLKRMLAFGRADYEVTDGLTLFTELSFARTEATFSNSMTNSTGSGALTIRRDNAFLPETLRTQMTNSGVTSLTMTRYTTEAGPTITRNINETTRMLFGAEGKLGGLRWNASYQHGENTSINRIFANLIPTRLALAVDAVRAPSGAIVCRSTLTDPTNGCVPFNPFGVGSPSQGSLDYVFGTSRVDTHTKQDFAQAEVSGDLFDNWAGTVSFAAGAEYRREAVTVAVQPDVQNFRLANTLPWSGHYTIKEVFAEAVVPLLADVPFAQHVELNLAGRHADYSNSGGVNSWKIGLNWQINDDLRFRGTRSRDIRAPNLTELYEAGASSSLALNDPFNAGIRVPNVINIDRGNPGLRPEIADTWVAGLVLQPSWLPNFNLAVDFYDIKVRDAIVQINGQQVLDFCFDGADDLCGFITRNGAGTLTSVVRPRYNFVSLKTRGVDVESSYRTSLGSDANLSLRGLLTYVDRLDQETPGAASIENAGSLGQAGAVTKWRAALTSNLEVGPFEWFLQGRYLGSGKIMNSWTEGVQADINHVKAQVYFDTQISYNFERGGGDYELYLNVQNLLDHKPPFVPLNGPTNAVLYDPIGRMFRAGVRFKF